MTSATHALVELARRKIDAVAMFRPLPGIQEDFFRSTCSEILLRGGNRSGKTICSAIRFAAIARDMEITTDAGEKIPSRLPHQKGRPLLMWVVGYDLKHIGQTIHRVLLRPGLYKIIKDRETGQFRAYDPVKDAGRESECKPSPPLIPPTEIVDNGESTDGISWENRGEKQFSTISLKNGTVICAYSSMGEVKAGDPVDVIWIDEKIKYPQHYPEWQARLSDRKGRIFWSSWPARDNTALREVSRRAKAKAENPQLRDDVAVFVLWFSKNPHIDDDEKAKRLAGWSEDERTARDRGDFALDSLKMYPSFSREIHCAYRHHPDGDDALAAALRKTNGQIPHSWTRYLILDPGTAHPAVLFVAVPEPDKYGHFIVPYDEIYVPRLDADDLAKTVLQRAHGEHFEAFIIDSHAARQTPLGFGVTVASNYSRAFRSRNLSCRTSGSHFTPGSDDVLSRIGMLQALMKIAVDGWPRLRIVTDRCPNLCRQLEEYERRESDGIVYEDPAPKQNIDVAVCLEYLASREPKYVPIPVGISYSSRAMEQFLKLRDKGGAAPVSTHLGPNANRTSA